MVGYHFFMLFDQPPSGRPGDGEDSNYGLVDLDDRPYTPLVSVLREMNGSAGRQHARAGAVPSPRADTEITAWPAPAVQHPTLVLGRARLPVRAPKPWHDEGSGASTRRLVSGMDPAAWLTFRGDTGTREGSGFGWTLPLSAERRTGRDLSGAAALVARLLVTRGKPFRVFLAEAGSAPTTARRFGGSRGADGESWMTPEYQGTGRWTDYVLPVARLVVRDSYGNPAGNERLDLQAIAWLDLYCPEAQGEMEVAVGPITAVPTTP